MTARQTYVILALAAVAVSVPANADAQRWAFGVRGGATIARLSGNGNPWPYRTGYSVGAALITPLAEKLSFQFEVGVTRKGVGTIVYRSQAATLTYLEFPFLVRSDLASVLSGPVRPVAYVGPAVSVLLSCRFFQDSDPAAPCSINRGSPQFGNPREFGETTTVDLGFMGGLGVEMDISPTLRTVVDARFEHGVFSIDKNYDGERNQVWTVSMMFLYVPGG